MAGVNIRCVSDDIGSKGSGNLFQAPTLANKETTSFDSLVVCNTLSPAAMLNLDDLTAVSGSDSEAANEGPVWTQSTSVSSEPLSETRTANHNV